MKMNKNVPKNFPSTVLLSEVKLYSLKRKSKQIFYPLSGREKESPTPYTFICKHNGQLCCLPPTILFNLSHIMSFITPDNFNNEKVHNFFNLLHE